MMSRLAALVALLSAVAMLTLTAAPLRAQDPAIGASLDEVRFGEHWFGPEIDAKSLKGKVVLMEMWGS